MESAHIFLVGMMGAGKSVLGRGAAAALGLPFVDLDAAIEARTGRSVANLFAERGEFEFRTCETQMLRELPGRHLRSVIATGGGAPLFFDAMKFMKATGKTVYLKVDGGALIARLEHARADRPLLSTKDWQPATLSLLAERAATYGLASTTLDTSYQTETQSLASLIQTIK